MKLCYICATTKHLDNHHVDCQHGAVSPDTVLLCRRCHRTYHNCGIEWFDDELLDRAIELENMHRKAVSSPKRLLEKKDIIRSDYWYKKHGVKRPKPIYVMLSSLVRPGIVEPLCGWAWLEENKGKVYPEQGITIFFNGKTLLALASTSTKSNLIKAVMRMAMRST
jgi:hypothetical protein